MSKPAITPDTKVGALLEAYPELEEKLIEIAPIFGKLKNPVLRKTVAKLATIEKAAGIAGIDTRELVLELRKAAGLPAADLAGGGKAPAEAGRKGSPDRAADRPEPGKAPYWATQCEIIATIDVESMLEKGEHPLARVRRLLGEAEKGNAVRLESGFQPLPLMEEMERAGFAVYSESKSEGRWTTYIRS